MIDPARLDQLVADALAAAGRRDAEVAVLASERRAARLRPDGLIEQTTDRSLALRYRLVRGAAEHATAARWVDGLETDAFNAALALLDGELDGRAYSSLTPGLLHPGMMSSSATIAASEPDSRTAGSGPAHLVDIAARALLAARDARVEAIGEYAIEQGGCDPDEPLVRLANTWGLSRAYNGVRARARFRFSTSDGVCEWVDVVAPRRGDLDPDTLFAAAARRVREAAGFASPPASGMPLTIEPVALCTIAAAYVSLVDQSAILDGRSPFRFGSTEMVAAAGIDIAFDPSDARNPGRPFDGEGVPSRRMSVVEDGRLGELARSRLQAEAAGDDAPGYAPLQPSLRPYRLRGAIVENTGDVHEGGEPDHVALAELGAIRLVEPRFGVAHAIVTRGWVTTGGVERALQPGHTIRLQLPDLFRAITSCSEPRAIAAGLFPTVCVTDPNGVYSWL